MLNGSLMPALGKLHLRNGPDRLNFPGTDARRKGKESGRGSLTVRQAGKEFERISQFLKALPSFRADSPQLFTKPLISSQITVRELQLQVAPITKRLPSHSPFSGAARLFFPQGVRSTLISFQPSGAVHNFFVQELSVTENVQFPALFRGCHGEGQRGIFRREFPPALQRGGILPVEGMRHQYVLRPASGNFVSMFLFSGARTRHSGFHNATDSRSSSGAVEADDFSSPTNSLRRCGVRVCCPAAD
jgi:hypothetical protein